MFFRGNSNEMNKSQQKANTAGYELFYSLLFMT